jgi:hypothetical protein
MKTFNQIFVLSVCLSGISVLAQDNSHSEGPELAEFVEMLEGPAIISAISNATQDDMNENLNLRYAIAHSLVELSERTEFINVIPKFWSDKIALALAKLFKFAVGVPVILEKVIEELSKDNSIPARLLNAEKRAIFVSFLRGDRGGPVARVLAKRSVEEISLEKDWRTELAELNPWFQLPIYLFYGSLV